MTGIVDNNRTGFDCILRILRRDASSGREEGDIDISSLKYLLSQLFNTNTFSSELDLAAC